MADLDKIDRRILCELSLEARISNVDLADRVGLSPSACLRCVQELERRGVITGYHARLDARAMGKSFAAYVTVGLASHTKASQQAFEEAMAEAEQATECHNITGAFEYLLRVEVSDLSEYKQFHTEVLAAIPGVAAIVSHVVMASPKDRFS